MRHPSKAAPLLIVSAATGYGGAERSMEIILRRLPPDLRVGIMVESAIHRKSIEAIARPRTQILTARTAERASFVQAVRSFKALYERLRPGAILANTHASARLLAAAASTALPGIDKRAFLYVRDFLWTDAEQIFRALPQATILAPESYVVDRPGYLAHLLTPDAGHKVAIIPDMVDVAGECPAAPENNAPFLHLATVNPWKGHAHLIGAMSRLRAQGVGARLFSVGYRPDAKRLERLLHEIDAQSLQDTMTLGDYEPDPARLIAACRAVVVSSVSHSGGPETFGRTIIEAWSHGRPVIAFAAGAPANLIRHEVDGLLVPEGDEQGLAAAMARLHHDHGLCATLGRQGFDRVRDEFEAGRVVGRLLDVLGEVPPRISRVEAASSRLRFDTWRKAGGSAAEAKASRSPPFAAEELRLLGACLARNGTDVNRTLICGLLDRVGYDTLFALVDRLRIAPLLIAALQDAGLVPPVPALTLPDGRRTMTREIEIVAEEHAKRRAVLTRHLTDIVAALNADGLVPVLIKGARSLWLDYPRSRTLRDLDILLEGRDADRAQSILSSEGYRPYEPERRARHHLAPLLREDLPGWIEIHQRAGNRYAEPLLPTRELVAESAEAEHPGGARARLLSRPHHVLHGLVHHHIGHSAYARGTLDIKGLAEFHHEMAGLSRAERQALLDRAARHPLLLSALDLWVAAIADLFAAEIAPPLQVRRDGSERWRAIFTRMTGAEQPRVKYPGYAEEIQMGFDRLRAQQVYPRLGPLAFVVSGAQTARSLLPKLPV